MIKLKPSVSSRSSSGAVAGFSFTAASAMRSSQVLLNGCARDRAHRCDLDLESDVRLHHRVGIGPALHVGLVGAVENAHAEWSARSITGPNTSTAPSLHMP